MFIVVYKEGSQYNEALIKETLEQAKALETDKYVFSWEGVHYGYELYKANGILCYNDDGQLTPFRHGKYTLTHITKVIYNKSSDGSKQFEFIFRYDNSKDVVIKSISREDSFPRTFSNAIKDILHASKFNSWEEYQENKVNVTEINKLKAENVALKKENEELKQKLAVQNTSA
jgi:hypothetical protein